MPVAPLRIVVPHRVVLDAAVVPERDRAHLPPEAALELRRLDVAIEELQERVALGLRELDDPGGEPRVNVERLASRHGMRAHDGMLGLRKHLALVLHAVAPAIDVLTLVARGEAF